MPFDKAINYQGNLKDTYICFYSQDHTFERIRRNPHKYLGFFKRCAGIIGFDYSIHSDMPIAKQISQAYDNNSLTIYYANNGIKVIPNIRDGSEEINEEIFASYPKYSMVCVGTYGFMSTKREHYEWYIFLKKIINIIKPSSIIIYGTLPDSLRSFLNNRIPFFVYPSWMSQNRKEYSNVNKR